MIHSAAITAPNAKPSLLFAVCFIAISSILDVYIILCVPGTLSIRLAIIGSSFSLFVTPNTHLFLLKFSKIGFANVIAVPLGASIFECDEFLQLQHYTQDNFLII